MRFILPEMAVRTKSLLVANRAICPERRPSCLILPVRLACPADFGRADFRRAHRLIACQSAPSNPWRLQLAFVLMGTVRLRPVGAGLGLG
ncbi:hypothetical protein SAMN05444171_5506 [Bradyrhizobium lablabi]|jgi:hypothetical protein|uniref:Uncharacterized protein n=2 Tax=Bradyrhizobium TaxID=374 RepID=A0ABY0PBS7_9BRAD|nr:hypothetical protein SAMN05444163_1665 [Bradyrhizobium ottawaense]SED87943.1 hypothetical protein SAMN05444171_5506 [Bradyrhizobium lablabi]SHL84271.1 hypothetical protein SAMN05444321_4297 [Bradyrhizobium lablabi]